MENPKLMVFGIPTMHKLCFDDSSIWLVNNVDNFALAEAFHSLQSTKWYSIRMRQW